MRSLRRSRTKLIGEQRGDGERDQPRPHAISSLRQVARNTGAVAIEPNDANELADDDHPRDPPGPSWWRTMPRRASHHDAMQATADNTVIATVVCPLGRLLSTSGPPTGTSEGWGSTNRLNACVISCPATMTPGGDRQVGPVAPGRSPRRPRPRRPASAR
ncbi:hypothetical protein BAY59_25375 [Prauserella coralliicola]|nr:hypothetical protein BAY59_25375 [Prauserella coralliicola]